MTHAADIAIRWYKKLILDRPVLVILCLAALIAFLGYQARGFKIDASAETLLLEHDADLRYSREVNQRYGSGDFLMIAYTPKDGDLLSAATREHLGRLRNELAELTDVLSVMTILDVPLLESPPLTYDEMSEGLRTLESPETDPALARIELRDSPFYRDLVVSRDMKTTAIIVNLKDDGVYRELIQKRSDLLDKRGQGRLSETESRLIDETSRQIRQRLDMLNVAQHKNIAAVRAIMDRYRDRADLFLGGVSMIADDMISFIRSDLKEFGIGVFLLLVGMLGIIFRRLRWIVLPMLCCFLSVVAMMGVLAMFDWEVTVISSNFISLQLIITLAIAVHLIVRYREFLRTSPESDQRSLVEKTIRTKFIPCLYAAATTIAGFSSLLLCDIKPVIHFGWMMSAGIVLSLALTFVLFPAALRLMPKESPATARTRLHFPLTDILARFTVSHGRLILVLTVLISVLGTMGISRLVVENSFIDYFKASTEIYQGMRTIDRNLGGTTPLDVIVTFPEIKGGKADSTWKDDEEFADLELEDLEGEDSEAYWFTDDRMKVIEKVHTYLENLPETGKVLSFGTIIEIGRGLNDGKALDSLEMGVLYTKLPDEYKKLIITPYLSFDHNEARFWVRVKDSLKSLKRDAFLKQVRRDLATTLGLGPDRVHLAGTMVLYNNMLQSLFASQIKTIGVVALALLVMFMILFRSLKLALIALFPNLFASGAVLGIMGWMNIPLDMMTITIAAISVGIAVDDTIHYIYRFREEIRVDGDYVAALHRCHGSIGQAMYYTSVTIIIGFSILGLSNFWPTIYFGLFTGLAMVIALVAALTLLPELIVIFRPFGNPTPAGEG
ncbi:MAG: RND family transporter [Desulfobacterales bacterium]|nr:RND family transporter [Desulfobacterales bacterium]